MFVANKLNENRDIIGNWVSDFEIKEELLAQGYYTTIGLNEIMLGVHTKKNLQGLLCRPPDPIFLKNQRNTQKKNR